MSTFFDENGNPVTLNNETNTPIIPEQPPRKIELSLKDKENNNYLEVDEDGEIKVKVTEMPPIEISTGDINVNVDNTVEITNDTGNPIPVSGNVNATVSGTVAVSNQPTSINVGNFPTTQQVSIADTVEVSIAGEPTVTISNPTTEIAVSNFPTQFDVNVLNQTAGEVEVTNFPTQFDVNVLNQTAGEVEVTNFPTEIAVNNHPTSIEVSNFPAPVSEVTVSNFPTEISVSNQPTSIEVSNFPTNQTVTIDGVADVNIANGQLSVEVLNNPTSINVDNFPITQDVNVLNTGFEATITNEVLTVDGDVSVITIPPIEIAQNQTVNIGTMPSINVSLDSIEVSNFPSTQNVVIEGSMVSVGVQMNGINTSDSLNTNITNTNIGTHLQTPDGTDITVKQHYYGSLENRLAVDAVLTQDVAVYIQPNQQIEVNNDVGNPIPVSGNISVTNTPTVKIDGALSDANGTTTVAVTNTAYGTLSTQLSGNDNNVKATIQGTPNVKVTNDTTSPVYVTGGVDVNLTNPQVEISNELGNPIPVVLSSIIPNLTPLNVQGTVDANVNNVVTVKSGVDSLQVDGWVSVNNFPTTQTITGTVDIGNQPIVSVNNFPTNFEISNEVGNPIPTVITNIIPNPTSPLYVQGTVDSNIVNEVTVKAGINPLQVGGTVIVDNMPSSFEINNDTGNPIPTTITNIPTVSVSSLPSITGTVTANINGIPNVNVLNTPSVNINNTPNVNINNTPTIQIDQVTTNANRVQVVNAGSNVLSTNIFASTSPSDNTPRTVTADTVGNLNVQLRNGVNPLSIDANGVASVKFNSTQNVNVTNTSAIPVQVNNSSFNTITSNALGLINNSNPLHVTLVDSGTKSSSQSVGTTAGGTTQLITGIAGKKIRVFALHITGLPPSTAGTLILRSQNSIANNFYRTRYAATAIFERTFEFGTNGLLLDEVGAGIQVITSSAFAGTNLDINIIYEEV